MQKVFCVGLWKTGTKTMGSALRMLGYNATHDFTPLIKDIEKKSIEELHDQNTWRNSLERISHLMNAFSAFSDTPWHFVYPYALSQYPNSKFILTTRESAGVYADSETAHCLAHNTPEDQIPNRELFMTRYHYHNSMIRRFIPKGQLLECEIETLDWRTLCDFLEKPVLDTPFPHLNKRITLENSR